MFYVFALYKCTFTYLQGIIHCRRPVKLRNFSERYSRLVKQLPECGDIVTVAGSDVVKDISAKAKDLTVEDKAKDC